MGKEEGKEFTMLVEFSIENFQSVGEKQTLFMQPSATRGSDRLLLDTGVKNESVLPVVAILGANASGKSTVIEAFKMLDRIVETSSERKKNSNFIDKRFRLNSKYQELPTRFHIKFTAEENILYSYTLGLYPERIVEENLTRETTEESVVLVDRNDDEGKIILHPDIYPDEAFLRVWKADINNKQTFLSYLGNKGDVTIFDPVLEWFSETLFILETLPSLFTSQIILNNDGALGEVRKFMEDADIHLRDVLVKEEKDELPDSIVEALVETLVKSGGGSEEEVTDKIKNRKTYLTSFVHETVDGEEVTFDFERDESKGTQAYYGLAGLVLGTLHNGACLFVDELENSLHPHLLRRIVQLFLNEDTNPNKAQLVFTTHDVTVMDKNLLHPDQIYFTEKDSQTYESSLFSLIDYKDMDVVGKKDRGINLYKYYLEGRFGAVPEVNWG